MSCKLCRKFRKKYPLKNGKHRIMKNLSMGSVECAFENRNFSTNNWNCETMNALRDLIDDYGHQERDDNCSGSIGFLRIPEAGGEYIQQGYLVMTWYKNRGRVGRAYVLRDDWGVAVLNLKTSEFIINIYKKRNKC